MKKLCLILAVAFSSICASAQFIVTSDINKPSEGENWGVNNFTNNLGIGYQVTDKCIAGIQRNGEEYDLFGRYTLTDNMYLSATMPTENSIDNVKMGVGYSIYFWRGVYIEPNYMMGLNTEDEGELKVGVGYRF